MFPMRHYPHLIVRVHPDRVQAVFLLAAYMGVSGLVWLLPLQTIQYILLSTPVAVRGIMKTLHAMQWSGAWSIREIVHTGAGRWILVDAQGRREKARLLHHSGIDTRMSLQFRDVRWRFRSVMLTPNNSHVERRRRLAMRLFYGMKPTMKQAISQSSANGRIS